jgi:hypothetical protein
VLAARLAAHGVVTDVPVVPDADTAREWARQELADPIYHQRESLLSSVIRWVAERFAELQAALGSMDGRLAAVVLGSLVLVAVLLVLLFVGPVRRARRVGRGSTEVFVDDERTAAELRASADALAAAGRWSEAVLDRYRAILRSLDERALLDDRPGRTAHEAAVEAAVVLPTCAADLHRASRLFDDVCYGDVRAKADDDAWLREVDATVRSTRPAARATPGDLLAVPR